MVRTLARLPRLVGVAASPPLGPLSTIARTATCSKTYFSSSSSSFTAPQNAHSSSLRGGASSSGRTYRLYSTSSNTTPLTPHGPQKGDRVIIALSGGVDSSVTALLLAQAVHFDLEAVFMRNWNELDESGTMEPGSGGATGCTWQRDWHDVQAVCRHLGNLPVKMVDLSREYWTQVFEPALDDWRQGTTPNPDSQVRELAKKHSLPTAERRESMGICFVGTRGSDGSKGVSNTQGFSTFLNGYITSPPGEIVDEHGQVVSTHRGLHTLTVGQGARICGATSKYYVAKKDIVNNRIVVVQGKQHPMLLCRRLKASKLHPFVKASAPFVRTTITAPKKQKMSAATSSCATTLDGPRTLRLHVWGASTTLPTLDPTSLYAVSLLRATFARDDQVQLQLASASTSLPRVPLLQVLDENNTTLELIDNVEAIRAFCVSSGKLDSTLASNPELAAKHTALHALLDDQLLDLTLHSLFSLPSNYRAVTAPAYSAVGGEPAPTNPLAKLATLPARFQPSIPSRLRNVVEMRLTAVGLWGLGGKEAAAKTGEADELAARAGIVPASKKGLGQSAREAVRDEFERSKLVNRWREVLDVIDAAVGGRDVGNEEVGRLDAHVFGFLAPLFFSKLPVDTLPRLVNTSYPRLATYLTTMRTRLFPEVETIWATYAQLAATPPVLDTPSTGSIFSYFWPFAPNSTSNKASSNPSTTTTTESSNFRSSPTRRKPTPSASPEDRRLRLGRALWICSAVVGLIGYTFASGVSEDDLEDELEEMGGTFNSPNLFVLTYDTLLSTLNITHTIPALGPHQYLTLGLSSTGTQTIYATTWAANSTFFDCSAADVDGEVGQVAYVADLGANAIQAYSFPQLEHLYTVRSKRSEDGPRHVIPHPHLPVVFTVTEHSNYVDAYQVPSPSSSGSLMGTIRHLAEADLLLPTHLENGRHNYRGDTLRFSSDLRYIYATTRGKTPTTQGLLVAYRLLTSSTANQEGEFDVEMRRVATFTTRTSGGKANAIELSTGTIKDDVDYMVLTDDEQGFVDVVSFDLREERFRVEATAQLPALQDGPQGASHAIWLL
ncbi:hypothetical protein [Sporisorium scitamineum]|uniref:Uncharacterized protein n=1 Tax=Sporisorium scitamineum TaxID=49012 RepID=A0A0F7S927_9BASI|nr:hypothetical protein [Sporisorium scitamineum]